jgi:hypothetical protein
VTDQIGKQWNSERRKWIAAAALVIALAGIQYAPVFLSGKIPFPALIVNGFPPYAGLYPGWEQRPIANIGDLVTQFFPYHALVSREVKQGRLPLWDPNVHSGEPLVGSTQAGIFYPPNALYFFMNVKRAWALQLVLERLLASLFTLLLLKELGGTPAGAIVSAALFAFCGFLIAFQGQAMADAAVWLPLICYALLRLHRNGSWRSTALVAISFAMPVLAGHPETAAHLAMAGLLVAAALTIARSPGGVSSKLRFVGKFIVGCLLGMGLAAVQMFPSVEWIANVHRSLNTAWPPLPLHAILSFVSRDIIRATNTSGFDIPEQAAYMGTILFLAAPLAALHFSKRVSAFLAAGVLGALSIIYGFGPLLPLLNSLHLIVGLKNSRLIVVASLGLAILAGLGVSSLQRWLPNKGSRWKPALLCAAGATTGLVMIWLTEAGTKKIDEALSLPRNIAILLIATALVFFARIAGRLSSRQFSLLAIAVLSFDVLTFSYDFLPFVRANEIFPKIELFDRLRQTEGDPYRVTQLGGPYSSNAEIAYELDSASGYGIPLERFYRFMEGGGRTADDGVGPDADSLVNMKDRRVDMLNIRYILVPSLDPLSAELRKQTDRYRMEFTANNTDVIENLHALPRARIVPASRVEIIENENAQLARLRDPTLDPERSVILSKDPRDGSRESGSPQGKSSVTWQQRTADSFQLKINAAENSILVASQIYYPGWKASVDGKIMAVVPADFAFMAVPLSAGSHDVQFFYDPESVKLGAVVSLISLILTVVLMLRREHNSHSVLSLA